MARDTEFKWHSAQHADTGFLCVPLTSVTRWHGNSRGVRPSPSAPITHRDLVLKRQ